MKLSKLGICWSDGRFDEGHPMEKRLSIVDQLKMVQIRMGVNVRFFIITEWIISHQVKMRLKKRKRC